MAEYNELSEERLRQAAEDFVRQGIDIRARVHDLTLTALTRRRFDRDAMRDVFNAITAGIARGAENAPDMRRSIADALKGMDEALARSAEAGATALRQLAATGRDFSETELKSTLANLKRLEDDFVTTVSRVADSASGDVRPEMRGALGNLMHAGTETGKQLGLMMNELTHRFAVLSVDAGLAGLEAAGEFGARFANLASGILDGIADALQKRTDTRSNP